MMTVFRPGEDTEVDASTS